MYLLYIAKNKIEIFKNQLKVSEVSWTKENLNNIFSQLKKNFSSHFRVLLSDQYINITSLLVSPKESNKRRLIQAKAQVTIDQDLNEVVWDYKVVANLGKSKLIQIIYVDKLFFNQLRNALSIAKIKIKLIESVSTSLCRFLPKNKLIFLLHQNLIIICFNRTPIYSKTLDNKLTQADIEEIFTYTKDRFKILPQQIFFSPIGDTAFSPYDFSSLTPEYLDINPVKGLIHSDNISGSDKDTSRLEVKLRQTFPGQPFLAKKIVIILVVSILVVLGLLFSRRFISSPNSPQLDPINPNLPTTTPTVIPTISLNSLKIQVLNGSGIVGQASKVSDILSQNNFPVTSTGNAPNFDFVTTEIQIKKSISSSVADLLIKSLEKQYDSMVSATKLNDSDEYDIKIITGQPLKN